ncbi:MAG: 30S ribosomal protein S4 [Cyanobacteria bacterium NC_groundwater_1444_Ag_S-0.65um_54_12]|nr:30S ribosomal protein S4 [Cyanobacteria bacterium NC_groundwater_1444_Ag_S-0.65um_54_12]
MARYTAPVCRLCRAEGIKLFLKGERCNTPKCAISRRNYRPGQHGQARIKPTEYSLRLREKQKARRFYGIGEKQFANYYQFASRKTGVTGEALLRLLERRLDNVVVRLGFAGSRAQGRQLVSHGHILIERNGVKRRVDIPSFLVRVGDVIAVFESSRDMVKQLIAAGGTAVRIPNWLMSDPEALTGKVLAEPAREEIDSPIKEQLIVEYYSR